MPTVGLIEGGKAVEFGYGRLFVSANLGLRPSPLDAAPRRSHVAQRGIASGGKMALGWHVNTKDGIHERREAQVSREAGER